MNSDAQWIRLGRLDPYLRTVRTLDPYKLDPNLPRDGKTSYFTSGELYVAHLFDMIERHVAPAFTPHEAVDFGCSVGRIAIPLAARCRSVIGLDVSTDALLEAERNAVRCGVTNLGFRASDDALSSIGAPVDLFHSYNVLQHLPVPRGMTVVRRAMSLLSPGGILAVHVPYLDRASRVRGAINWAEAHIPGVYQLANVARGRSFDYPHMLMNAYSLPDLLSMLHDNGCSYAHCHFIDQGRYQGVLLIAIARKAAR